VIGWQPLAKRIAFVLIFIWFVWAIGRAADAEAHYNPGLHNTRHAITWGFCGHTYRECAAGLEAKQVASCETGGTMSVYARSSNGLWWGLFQQSSYSRAFGQWRWNAWAQADSAYRAWRANGFCWTCAQQWPHCGRGLDG
jgi:hypothetical protein